MFSNLRTDKDCQNLADRASLPSKFSFSCPKIYQTRNWKGIRCPWLGTKQVWKFLADVGLFDKNLNNQIQNMKPKDWSLEFCENVYDEVAR